VQQPGRGTAAIDGVTLSRWTGWTKWTEWTKWTMAERCFEVCSDKMTSLFTTPRARVLTIGVGSMGCAAARMGAENGDESGSVCWSALHANAAELIATGLEQKFFLKIPEGPFAAQHIAQS